MKKRKTRFNLLDLLIILAVGALVVGVMWRQELTDKVQIMETKNTVSVLCDAEIIDGDLSAEGDNILIYMDGVEVGKAAKALDKLRFAFSAVSKDSGYYLESDAKLFIDGEYKLHTKTEEFTVRIVSIIEE